jgi:hypothetical protein
VAKIYIKWDLAKVAWVYEQCKTRLRADVARELGISPERVRQVCSRGDRIHRWKPEKLAVKVHPRD